MRNRVVRVMVSERSMDIGGGVRRDVNQVQYINNLYIHYDTCITSRIALPVDFNMDVGVSAYDTVLLLPVGTATVQPRMILRRSLL